jgi:ribosomal protein S18 acetylase RimI-like enzyme
MPRIVDLTRVRAMLESDRPWAAYALGDLSPGLVEHAEWFAGSDDDALLLLLHAFDLPIFFALGDADRVAPLLGEIAVPAMSLQVRPEIAATLATRYVTAWLRPMWRMMVEPERFRPVDTHDVVPLGAADVDAITRLFSDGTANGETPHFFFPSMVTRGIFRGIRAGTELVAVAGTHMVDSLYGICAVGNVYVRRDHRGRGLAARTTSAVVAEAVARRLPTIVLNVSQGNDVAARIYDRLGFKRYCPFVEGVVTAV